MLVPSFSAFVRRYKYKWQCLLFCCNIFNLMMLIFYIRITWLAQSDPTKWNYLFHHLVIFVYHSRMKLTLKMRPLGLLQRIAQTISYIVRLSLILICFISKCKLQFLGHQISWVSEWVSDWMHDFSPWGTQQWRLWKKWHLAQRYPWGWGWCPNFEYTHSTEKARNTTLDDEK